MVLTAPLDTLTSQLTDLLHTLAISSFPHTPHRPVTQAKTGTMPQNDWYDDECRDTRARLLLKQARGEISAKQAKRAFQSLTRRKKRAFEIEKYWALYQLFLSNNSAEAWKKIREHRPPTPITTPQVWHTYGESLYHIPDQPPLPHPPQPRPSTSTFFTTSMVKKAIKKLQHGRAQDHTGMRGEHLVFASHTLAPFIAHLFNRALVEGFPHTWSTNTIAPIHKAGDRMDPGNYRTIMIGHILAKLYGSILEDELSTLAKDTSQTVFRRNFSTLDHIFTLRSLIEQARADGRRLYCCFVDFRKAFDTVPRDRLLQRLQSLKVSSEMIWGIIALYERVIGRFRCPVDRL